jgi:hypothetical protein
MADTAATLAIGSTEGEMVPDGWGTGTLLWSLAAAGAGAAALFGGWRSSDSGGGAQAGEGGWTEHGQRRRQAAAAGQGRADADAPAVFHYAWSSDITDWDRTAADQRRELGAVAWSQDEPFKLLVGRCASAPILLTASCAA